MAGFLERVRQIPSFENGRIATLRCSELFRPSLTVFRVSYTTVKSELCRGSLSGCLLIFIGAYVWFIRRINRREI